LTAEWEQVFRALVDPVSRVVTFYGLPGGVDRGSRELFGAWYDTLSGSTTEADAVLPYLHGRAPRTWRVGQAIREFATRFRNALWPAANSQFRFTGKDPKTIARMVQESLGTLREFDAASLFDELAAVVTSECGVRLGLPLIAPAVTPNGTPNGRALSLDPQPPATGVRADTATDASAAPPGNSDARHAKGAAEALLISGLLAHHRYDNGSCGNFEPVKNNRFAGQLKVGRSTASDFFDRVFGGHPAYIAACRDGTRLCAKLKILAQDYSDVPVFGRTPPGEGPGEKE
jgi:hypothetical protein